MYAHMYRGVSVYSCEIKKKRIDRQFRESRNEQSPGCGRGGGGDKHIGPTVTWFFVE